MNRDKAIKQLNKLFPSIREYQKLAKESCSIQDIFQDNGGKLLQVLLITGLKNESESREGNDAIDDDGVEYELKSVNKNLTRSFSTNHHLNLVILAKYRQVDWVFAVYEDIELLQLYVIHPNQLEEDFFSKWELKIKEELKKDANYKGINNPKIPLSFVVQKGTLIYDNEPGKDFYTVSVKNPKSIKK